VILFLLAAHSCHPGQINDGLLGVALGIDLFKHLKKQSKHHYSYRLIVGLNISLWQHS